MTDQSIIKSSRLKKIISGGQTGADRAALDAAMAVDFPVGGYCPAGRLAEDGEIAPVYPLVEIEGGYRQRTKRNVTESDGTAIFYQGRPRGGTELTLLCCIKGHKPYKLIDIDLTTPTRAATLLSEFIAENQISILNVAGPRASSCPSVYPFVLAATGAILGPGRE